MSPQDSQLQAGITQRILEIAYKAPSIDGDTPEAVDFDWTAPRHFTGEQLETLNGIVGGVSRSISKLLTALLPTPIKVHPQPVSQHYGPGLQPIKGQIDYWASIVNGSGDACGLLIMPASMAVGWVAKLLGSVDENAGEDRDLSPLEKSLLTDILDAIGRALSDAFQVEGKAIVRLEAKPTKGHWELPGGEAEEFCRMLFSQEDQEQGVSMLISSETFDSLIVGQDESQARSSTADSLADLEQHVLRSTIRVDAWLGTARATMQDLAALDQGDILLVQKKTGEPVDVMIGEKVILTGLLAKSGSNYAIQIVTPTGRMESVSKASAAK